MLIPCSSKYGVSYKCQEHDHQSEVHLAIRHVKERETQRVK
jgi:hypothetical protein